MVDGHAALSPLRFFYDSDEFALPIRLGMANIAGHARSDRQHHLARQALRGRELPERVRSRRTSTSRPSVKTRFGEFYAALFDETIETQPGRGRHRVRVDRDARLPLRSVSRRSTSRTQDIMTLGGDVVGGDRSRTTSC